MGSFLI